MPRDYVLNRFQANVELKIDYAAELNEQQHAAVTAVPGPALVIAGAGSGKTRTLTYRVAYLIEQGIPPDRILLLTFTNKAAREMMRRVGDLLGADTGTLWGGTFHAVGLRVLRRESARIGYPAHFTILDREDAKDLLQACIDASNIDIKETRFPKAEVVYDILSMAVNTRQTIAEVLAANYEHFAHLAPHLLAIAEQFQQRKRQSQVMDFDDLLDLWLKLLQSDEPLRTAYQRRFQFILVDEYQDTNRLQSELIDLLAAQHHNLMVVGDDSQSIYSWRGANFRNILEFPQRYSGSRIYKIETNYRSTPEILAVANAAIAPNRQQFEKLLVAARGSGPKPMLVPCGDAFEQAAFVAQRALELRDEGIALNDMAVLYRSHFHALELQLELTRRNIPHSITSGIRFFEQAHVKDVAAYLKLAHNPFDELAFKRLVRLLPGVGGKMAEKLWHTFSSALTRPQPTVPAPPSADDETANPVVPDPPVVALTPGLTACTGLVPKKSVAAWQQFAATMDQLSSGSTQLRPSEMIQWVLEAGYEEYVQETYSNFRTRLEDLEQLSLFAEQYRSVAEFLSQVALVSNADDAEGTTKKADDEQMKLSTIHQAKGLEFKVVFVIMLCDGLFPSARSLDQDAAEEEERRLFYVAITRAKNELYLSYPLIRAAGGFRGDPFQTASRFLRDIPKELIEELHLRTSG